MKKMTLLFVFLFTLNINAQWASDTAINLQVVDSANDNVQSLGTSDGKTYVVYWQVAPSPVNYELKLQVLDVDGTKLLGSDGMLISDAIPMSTYTVFSKIVVDASDNLYIGVTGTGTGSPAYAFKMDINGNQLWGTNGIVVGSGFSTTVLPMTNGNAIVAWSDNGVTKMLKYDANGNAIWGSVVSDSNASYPADLYEMSNGDFVMLYHEWLYSIKTNLYAQRYDSNGASLWTTPSQLSNKETAFNQFYSGAQDGDIIYYGYSGVGNNRFDSYLQRLNPDGTLPWGINGSDFDTSDTKFEMSTSIAIASGSQFVWSISNYSNFGQSNNGEYIQKFDKNTGSRQFTDTAKELFALGSENVHVSNLHLVNDQPLFLLKKGSDNGATPTTLDAVYLDENGDFVWVEESKPVATYLANKGRISFTKPVNGQSVAVFVEDKGSGTKIYAQNFMDNALSIDDFDVNNINLWVLNPIENSLQIKSASTIKSIKVFDVLGKLIFDDHALNTSHININVQSWKSGLYILNIETIAGIKKGIKVIKR